MEDVWILSVRIQERLQEFEFRRWQIRGCRRGFRDFILCMIFRDQDQEVCPLILPKVKADKPRIGKDGIFADERGPRRTRREVNLVISLT